MLTALKGRHLRIKSLAMSGALAFSISAVALDYNGAIAPGASNERPKEIQGVGIDEKLGHSLDLNLPFKDEKGQAVTLAQYFDGKTPVILSPVYFDCPGLCNFHLNGLTDGMKGLEWNIGNKFKVLSISFDPKEGPEKAASKKESYLTAYGRTGPAETEAREGWHFLTGDAKTITALMTSLGFKYHWDAVQNDWAHASAAVILSPQGEVTRYLPGIMFDPKDLKLALNEAAEGKIGSFVDSLVLYCFQYNTHQGKYSLYAFNIVKVGGALMVLLLALWLLPVWVRTRRDARSTAGR